MKMPDAFSDLHTGTWTHSHIETQHIQKHRIRKKEGYILGGKETLG